MNTKRKIFTFIIAVILSITTIFSSSVYSYNIKENSSRNIVLLLDASGSMDDSRMASMRESATKFCEELLKIDNTEIAVITIKTYAYLTCSLTNDFDTLKNKIGRLAANGGTNIYEALEKADGVLKGHEDDDNSIVLMTDGYPESGQYSYQGKFSSKDGNGYQYANSILKYVDDNNFKDKYKLYTLGYVDADDTSIAKKLLEELGYSGNYTSSNFNELTEYFKSIAQDINKYVTAYIYDVETLDSYDSYKDKDYINYIVTIWIQNDNPSREINNLKIDCNPTNIGSADILNDYKIPKNEYDNKENYDHVQSIDKIEAYKAQEVKVGFRIRKDDFKNGGTFHFICSISGDKLLSFKEYMSFYVNAINEIDNRFKYNNDMWKQQNYQDTDKDTDANMTEALKEAYNHGIDKPTDIAALKENLETVGTKGHCYGLSASAILEKMGVQNIRNSQRQKYLYDVKVGSREKALIHYYQASQIFKQKRAANQKYYDKYCISSGSDWVHNTEKELEDLENSVKKVQTGGCPVLLSLKLVSKQDKDNEQSEDQYHAIVAYGYQTGNYRTNNTTYKNRLLVYDCNSEKFNRYSADGEYYLYYNDYKDGFFIPAYSPNYDITINRFFDNLNDINLKNVNDNYMSELILRNKTSVFAYMNNNSWCLDPKNSNQYITPIESEFKQLLHYKDSDVQDDNGYSPLHVVLPKNDTEYKVMTQSGSPEELDFELLYSHSYLSVRASLAEGAILNSDNSITLKNNHGKFTVILSSDKISDNNFSIYTVNGNAENSGDIVLRLTDNGIKAEGEHIKGIKIEAENRSKNDNVIISDKNSAEYLDTGKTLENVKKDSVTINKDSNRKEIKNESQIKNNVNTGDNTQMMSYVILSIMALYSLYLIKKWKSYQK